MTAKVRDYYATETEHLLSCGVEVTRIADQLGGVRLDTLARALHRERRHDLANVVERTIRQEAARINRQNRSNAA